MKNHDPAFILISRKHFNALLGQARVGDGEVSRDNATDKAVANIRELNPFYDEELKAEEAAEKAMDERLRERARQFVEAHKGQEVWLIDSHGYGPDKNWQGAMFKICKVLELAEEYPGRPGNVLCSIEGETPRANAVYIGNLVAKTDVPPLVPMTEPYWAKQKCWQVAPRINSET